MQFDFALPGKLVLYAFALWLGAYLIARGSRKVVLRLTGLGLVCYALALVVDLLSPSVAARVAFLPGLAWIGATLYLVPEDTSWRKWATRGWLVAALPLAILVGVIPSLAIIIVLAMLGCELLIGYLAWEAQLKNTLAVLALVGLLFTLSTGLLIVPLDWLPRAWVWLSLGLDLIALGLVISVWDAFDEGAALRPHMARSFVGAFFYAGALAALVVLTSAADGDIPFGGQLLLVGVISFGITSQVFAEPVERLFDRLSFFRSPSLVRERETLRSAMDVLPSVPDTDPLTLDHAEFARLTRRALSSMGDLSKLASSPLTNLPSVRASANPLDRAQALKTLLTVGIVRLKPQNKGEFGTTDEWRHYNALYFPYVVGIKPYSQRGETELDETSRKALEWFRTSVPERTLHNWQNAAARLVADDLRSRQ